MWRYLQAAKLEEEKKQAEIKKEEIKKEIKPRRKKIIEVEDEEDESD